MKRDSPWHETTCSECGRTFYYHIDWNRIPNLCKDCIDRKKSEWKETHCSDCGTTIKYHVSWDRVPDLCKSCKEKRRTQWRETRCKDCGSKFPYHIDWQNIPDYCEKCNQWLRKHCEYCSGWVEYKIWWENPPSMCKDCYNRKAEITLRLKKGSERLFFSADELLPYLNNTPRGCGYNDAVVYFEEIEEKGVVVGTRIHVTLRRTDSKGEAVSLREDRLSYYLEPATGRYIEDSAHASFGFKGGKLERVNIDIRKLKR